MLKINKIYNSLLTEYVFNNSINSLRSVITQATNKLPLVKNVKINSYSNNSFHSLSYNATKRYSARVLQKKYLSSSNKNENFPLRSQLPKTPDLIYFPHIIRWLNTKMRFKYLKHFWDPTFSEGAFIFGSTQAICRITEIINKNKPEELDDLVSAPTKAKLMEDIKKKLTDKQRQIIRLVPDDIKILVPMSVHLNKSIDEKSCKIVLRALALKWHPHPNGILKLVLVALQTDFFKTYNKDNKDWIITAFDVMECTTLTEPANAK